MNNYTGNKKTKDLVQLSMLVAIIAILTFTPLGFVPIPPIWATTVHIPVIVGGVVMGPLAGGILGLTFGLFSMFKAISIGDAIQIEMFVQNPQVAIIPRILIGVVAGYVYKYFSKNKPFSALGASLAAVAGTLTNTVLVLGGVYIFTRHLFAIGLLTTALTVLAEVALAVIITIPVGNALIKMGR